MNKDQAGEFLVMIAEVYPNYEATPGRLKMWAKQLANMDFSLAVKRLEGYISLNQYPPTVADIVSSGESKQRQRNYDETKSPAEEWGTNKKKDWGPPFFAVMKTEYDQWVEAEKLLAEEKRRLFKEVG